MILGSFVKQPSERLDYDVDYGEWVVPGDNIYHAGVSVATSSDEIAVDRVTVSDPVVKLWIVGGVNGQSYKVTLTVTTEDGRIKEDELIIVVRDF